METALIEMDVETAREAAREYRASVKERSDEEMEQILAGYRALARGTPLLRMSETIRTAGIDESGMPRLAVCRADERWCRANMDSDGSVTFTGYKQSGWTGDENHRATRRKVHCPEDTLPRREWSDLRVQGDKAALVPLVPPQHRPKFSLANYHILWEAEWRAVPPVDPMLLKRIGGDLFAVVAMWDLSELEQAVLAGRLAEA